MGGQLKLMKKWNAINLKLLEIIMKAYSQSEV